jgi:hypothetical protein
LRSAANRHRTGNERIGDQEVEAQNKIHRFEKQRTDQMIDQAQISDVLKNSGEKQAELLKVRIEGEEKLQDMEAEGDHVNDALKGNPEAQAKHAKEVADQLKIQQKLNKDIEQEAQRQVNIEQQTIGIKIRSSEASVWAAQAELAGKKDTAEYVKIQAEYEQKVQEINSDITLSESQRREQISNENDLMAAQISLAKRRHDDEMEANQAVLISGTLSADAAEDKNEYDFKGAALAEITAKQNERNTAIMARHLADKKQEAALIADSNRQADAERETAGRSEKSRLVGVESQIQKGRDLVAIQDMQIEGRERDAEITKIWADYVEKSAENAVDFTKNAQQREQIEAQLQTAAAQQVTLQERQYAIAEAQVDAERRIAQEYNTDAKKRLESIQAQIDAENIAVANSVGLEKTRHQNKLQNLKDELAAEEIKERHMSGAEKAQRTRDAHALERQERIDDRKENGQTWVTGKTSDADWMGTFNNTGVSFPVPAPIPKAPITPPDQANIGQQVGAAMTAALAGKMLVVKEMV